MDDRIILRVRNITKTFGGIKAVNDLSFDLCQGEILGIIGPNGSGKTTLTNCITSFVKKGSGTVIFKGEDISNSKAYEIADKGLLRTFQIMRPYHGLPAFKNLVIPLYSPRAKRSSAGKFGDRDEIALNLLEDVGFDRGSSVPFKLASSLPTGYLKRIELARCLALKPDVLITDEIFSGLSVSEVTTMVPLIEKIQMQGITIIMIEHRIRELFKLANRIIVLNFGQKIAEEKPEQVLLDEEVKKAYLGSSDLEEGTL
jgi:ABC-type branched-subunit amino acid transport system ATPase component